MFARFPLLCNSPRSELNDFDPVTASDKEREREEENKPSPYALEVYELATPLKLFSRVPYPV